MPGFGRGTPAPACADARIASNKPTARTETRNCFFIVVPFLAPMIEILYRNGLLRKVDKQMKTRTWSSASGCLPSVVVPLMRMR